MLRTRWSLVPWLGTFYVLSLFVHLTAAGVIYEVYKVGTGDTMEAIATRFSTTPEIIRRRNGLAADAPIYIGQSLIVPVGNREDSAAPVTTTPAASAAPTSTRPPTPPPASTGGSTGRVVGRLGTIVANGAKIRSGRSARGRVYFAPQPGMQLVVTQQAGDWFGVLMSNGATGWVPKKYARLESVELVSKTPIFSGAGGGSVVAEAYKYLGVPYHYGGNGASGIDCSALVKRTYLASRGVNLPRTAAEQARVGMEVPTDQLQSGDRIYFSRSGSRIDHCGIYMGNGQFIHASGAASRVTVSSLYEPKYWSWFRVARR